MINRLDVVSIPVSDQDRAKAFYRDVLGLEELADQRMMPQMRWVQLAPKGAATSVRLVNWFDSMPPGSLRGLVLHSDDLDTDIAALAAKGVKTSPVEAQPWGRFVTLSDPDGNGLVLQQRP